MAIKNIQTVARCAAERGVRVAGTDMVVVGKPMAPLSLPGLPRPGYPTRKGLDLQADNTAEARTGRSVSGSARLAVISKRPSILFTGHRERQAMRETWSKLARG